MDTRLRSDITEAILRRAVIDAYEQDMADIMKAIETEEPHVFSEAHNARMRALFKREERKDLFIKIYNASKRAAVVILIIATAFLGILLTDSRVQATVSEVIIRWYDQFTMFRFQDEGHEVGYREWFPDFIPEGFEITNFVEFYIGRFFHFEHANGHYIYFNYFPVAGSFMGVDNEFTMMEILIHDGVELHVFTPIPGSDHDYQVHWAMDGYVFTLVSTLDSEILLNIAFSVNYNYKGEIHNE
ncbi:MAG: DUF4367 domain-containing protein [Defluviitaleaceae bacterium]|nr:DUF4367 domain-containing protein [Defluviitaleaceae bacterium]